MYTYQSADGWFHISLYASQRARFADVLKNRTMLLAYEAPYASRHAAEKARVWIDQQAALLRLGLLIG